jgi:beta-mannosidase
MILTFVGLLGRIGPIPASQSADCEFVIYFIRHMADSYSSRLDSVASTWLVFDGLDTFATIELCGQPVGTANNQFRQWTYDVSNILESCQGEPIISINFGSAPTIAIDIANEPGQESELGV